MKKREGRNLPILFDNFDNHFDNQTMYQNAFLCIFLYLCRRHKKCPAPYTVRGFLWWLKQDLNLRHSGYEAGVVSRRNPLFFNSFSARLFILTTDLTTNCLLYAPLYGFLLGQIRNDVSVSCKVQLQMIMPCVHCIIFQCCPLLRFSCHPLHPFALSAKSH